MAVHSKEDMIFSYLSDDLLDHCSVDIYNKEDTTFSYFSDNLLDHF
ncbi:1544_t:CDS:1, partial [Dentiscutata heterogama]